MQLTLDLIIPKEEVAEIANYQHPLKNFRDLAIANGTIFKQDDMGVLRQACLKYGLNQAGWRFLKAANEYWNKLAGAGSLPDAELCRRLCKILSFG